MRINKSIRPLLSRGQSRSPIRPNLLTNFKLYGPAAACTSPQPHTENKSGPTSNIRYTRGERGRECGITFWIQQKRERDFATDPKEEDAERVREIETTKGRVRELCKENFIFCPTLLSHLLIWPYRPENDRWGPGPPVIETTRSKSSNPHVRWSKSYIWQLCCWPHL